VLATKYTLNTRPGDPNAGGNHRKAMVQSLHASLDRLKTDYIDVYWVHIRDQFTPVEEIVRALDDLVAKGQVLYVGISDTPAWQVAQAVTLADLRGWTRFAGLQVPYSLVERTVERELLPMARSLELTVTAWSPLRRRDPGLRRHLRPHRQPSRRALSLLFNPCALAGKALPVLRACRRDMRWPPRHRRF